jgi:hypothetical protein
MPLLLLNFLPPAAAHVCSHALRSQHTMRSPAASMPMAHPLQRLTCKQQHTSSGMKILSLQRAWPHHQTLMSSSV